METTLIPAGTVLVGLDGSASSERALDWAIDHAVREHRQLTLVHGLEPMHEHSEAREILRHAREHCHGVAPGLAVHEALWTADPRAVLHQLGTGAATVVVGSHGRGPVRSLLLGSVGLSVTRHAPCPVVVVRPYHPGVVRNGVLVHAGERSRPVVEYAYRQAALRDLPLTILRSPDDALGVAEAVAGLSEKFPEVRTRTVSGDVAHESARMDLVVVGSDDAGVVGHAQCPVAVVPLGVAASPA
ncbi:universal stress protein [Nocardioides aquiterrae]|uniref:Universal stress protein n=1 Tax=Nocardioides aquiterrae TaxID=203799 RepID=A0ABN1URB2_9ACTN